MPGVAIPAEDGVGRDLAMAAAPAAAAAGALGPASERAGLCHGPAAFQTAGEGWINRGHLMVLWLPARVTSYSAAVG